MVDLIVRGAGIFGLSIAWTALQRGAKVQVIDPAGPGAGASGGVVGALQPHTPDPWNTKKQFQFESLMMAKTFWPEVDEVSGRGSGFANVGRIMPLSTDREVKMARSRKDAAVQNWGDAATWQVIKSPGAWCPPSSTGYYVHDTLSAILHPRYATKSLAAAVQAKGGEFVQDGPDGAPTIWATGWKGLLDLSAAFGRPVGNGVKGQAAVLNVSAVGQPQIYAEGLHMIAHMNGILAIGSTSERDFTAPDTTDSQLDALIQKARDILGVHDASVLGKWAGVRPRAKSRAPLLGPWPGRPGHFIANGGFKIGFGMAPKVAEVMVDLVLDGSDAIPAEFHTDAL